MSNTAGLTQSAKSNLSKAKYYLERAINCESVYCVKETGEKVLLSTFELLDTIHDLLILAEMDLQAYHNRQNEQNRSNQNEQ